MAATMIELHIKREFNAQRTMVWQAWTDTRHLPYWWGPKGMPTSVISADVRVGGDFRYSMQRPDGTTMWGKFTYKEIRAPEKLVWINSFTDDKGNVIRAPFGGPWDKWPLEIEYTITLTETNGRTALELRGVPINTDEAGWAVFREMHDNVTAGFNATMDQLEYFLRGGSTVTNSDTFKLDLVGDTEIETSRVFDAPKRLVYLAHTTAEHIQRWWGPRGMEITVPLMDFRKGGRYRIVHRDPQGNEYAFRGEYLEIVPEERLSMTFEFEGMPGHIAIETLHFTEAGGRTTLSSTMKFKSKSDRDGMAQSGMESGARQTWDRLEELLSQFQAK